MFELFDYLFFRNAVAGALLVSLLCGLVGSYIVVRRLVFISGGITHASFGGLGLGFYLGWNPVLTAALFAIASAFGVQWLSGRKEVREDSAIAVFWSLGMALGILFIFMTPGYVPGMTEFLFGNILTITQQDLWQFAALTALLIGFFWFFYHTILYVAFDNEFARSQKLPVRFVEYAMMLFIALTIVFSIRLIGIVLLVSMLTIPQMTASLYTRSFKGLIMGSIAIGVVSTLSGLVLSYYLNVPTGAFIIVISIVIYLLAKLCKTSKL